MKAHGGTAGRSLAGHPASRAPGCPFGWHFCPGRQCSVATIHFPGECSRRGPWGRLSPFETPGPTTHWLAVSVWPSAWWPRFPTGSSYRSHRRPRWKGFASPSELVHVCVSACARVDVWVGVTPAAVCAAAGCVRGRPWVSVHTGLSVFVHILAHVFPRSPRRSCLQGLVCFGSSWQGDSFLSRCPTPAGLAVRTGSMATEPAGPPGGCGPAAGPAGPDGPTSLFSLRQSRGP